MVKLIVLRANPSLPPPPSPLRWEPKELGRLDIIHVALIHPCSSQRFLRNALP